MTRTQGIIFFILSLIVVAILIYPSRFGIQSYPDANTTLFEAVPTDASLIIEFNSLNKLQEILKEKSYTLELQQSNFIQQFSKEIKLFNKLFYKSEVNRQIINEGELLTVLQPKANKTLEFLHIAKHEKILVDLDNFKSEWLKSDNGYSDYNFEGYTVYELEFSTFEKVSFCIANDLMLLSRNSVLIEKALSELENPRGNVSRQQDFLKVRSKTGNNADCSIYMNFTSLPNFLTNFVNTDYLKAIQQTKTWGSWLGLDISFSDKGFDLNGYFAPNKKNKFFKALKKEDLTDSITIDRALPDNTAYAFNFNSENFRKFIKNKRSNTDEFDKYFLNWMGENITYVVTEPTEKEFKDNQYWIVEVKDYEQATYALNRLGDENGELQLVRFPPHQLRGFVIDDLFSPIFGKQFEPIRNPYYTFINKKYIVFANSSEALKLWVDKLDFSQTLAQDINYQLFSTNVLQVANVNQYFNFANAFHIVSTFLHNDLQQSWEQEFMFFEKIKPISVQLTPYGDLQVVNIKALFDKKGKQPTSVVWRSELEANAIIPPKVVKNHDTGENEIFVQDENFKAYLLDRNGEILWTKQLDGKILSDVHQIDFYKNKKLQYLFNTTIKIHLIDRNGDNVASYPRKLGAKTTNGITVLDYDGKLDYRIFVACDDANIYGFLKNGEPLNGWSPQKNVGIVRQPIMHFTIDKLDYLITLNDSGLVYVFQRNGEMRIEPTDLELGGNKINSTLDFDDINSTHKRVVAVDAKGKAYIANLQGKKFNLSMKIGNNENVKFCLADVVGDIRKDYIVMSNRDLRINYYDELGSFRKSYKARLPIAQQELFSVQLADREKAFIGTISNINNEIFLLDNKARIIKDFPLAGSTPFEITDFFGDGKNILTVANDNLIYTYRLSYLSENL